MEDEYTLLEDLSDLWWELYDSPWMVLVIMVGLFVIGAIYEWRKYRRTRYYSLIGMHVVVESGGGISKTTPGKIRYAGALMPARLAPESPKDHLPIGSQVVITDILSDDRIFLVMPPGQK